VATSDTLIDKVLDGRYRVLRRLGSGGMAVVYLAEDEELGRQVAIKMLDERHAQDQQFVERFRREASNAARLSHPNIVAIYDRGRAEGTYYIAMEYVEGKTLKQLLVERGPTPVRVAIDYARQILAALDFAHRHGIVHRDIKPHNVIVAPDGRLKVTDFGIARSGTSQMTEAGSIVGTAQYLSPEQARGSPVSPASDIYSVGIVLYEMLTGTVPFTGDTPLEIAMKHLSSVPEPPSTLRPEVPRALDQVVLRCLAKNPQDRYPSARDMDADLVRVAGGLSASAETEEAATQVLQGAGIETAPTQVAGTRAPAPPTRGPTGPASRYYEYDEPVRRRPLWPWLLALLLLAAAGVAGFYVYSKVQDQLAEAKPIAVPTVEGKTEAAARQALLAVGLNVRIRRVFDDKAPPGQVIDQNPGGGVRVDRATTVLLTVSKGKAKTVVPDLVGKTLADAVAELTRAGLKASVFEVYSERPAGSVSAQSIAPGTSVLQGATVRINVSKGLKPIPVPPVVGKVYEEAVIVLQKAGFRLAPPKLVDSSQPRGTVLSMDPPGGSQEPRGTTVTLTVSKGPKTVRVPNVVDLDEESAKAALRASGLKAAVTRVKTSDPGQDGLVLSQIPGEGAELGLGSTVTIVVGSYEPPPTTTVPAPPPTLPTTPTSPPTTPAPPTGPPPTTTPAPTDTVPLP